MCKQLLLCLVGLAGLLASGCAIPHSEHPLSDEETSTLDERLIGYWNIVPKGDDKPPPAPYVISRVKDKPNVLQLMYIELDGEGHATVHTTPIYTTKLDKEHYLSINLQSEKDKKPAYLLFRYELTDADTCQLYLPGSDAVAAAIEGGKLKGTVKRQARKAGDDPNKPAAYEEIRISAETKELAAFFKDRGKALFVLDEPATFKRVKTE